MTNRMNRRRFLAQTTAVAGAAAGLGMFPAPAVLAKASPNSAVGVAVIGCANQGTASVNEIAKSGERFVAFADVDDRQYAKTRKTLALYPEVKFDAIPKFSDYRKMFDKLHKQIDVVFVCTPDHHHATASMIAMKLGKGVYCEKPLAHSVDECRRMAEAAEKYKVITQLGNQGHSGEGIRRVCEYIWAGAIGHVREVHAWAPTGRGGVGGRLPTRPVPKGLHWDVWIGPAHYRDYHAELHPALWRSWWEFGDGSLGDWGCHNLDGPFWALNLIQAVAGQGRLGLRPDRVAGAHFGKPGQVGSETQPTSAVGSPSYTAEAVQQVGGSDERYPLVNALCWDFPVRGDLPPVKVYWYDGYRAAKTANPKKELGEKLENSQNRPPLALELEKKYHRRFGDGGTIYVGDKGIMFSDNWCRSARIVPEEQHRATPVPAKKLPRFKGSHQIVFLRAFKEGKKASSDFAYGARLTEMLQVGLLAERAGLGKKVEWDATAMACTNIPELNRFVRREYRKGWEL